MENRIEFNGGRGERRMGNYCLMSMEFLFGITNKLWKWMMEAVMVGQHVNVLNASELYT